MKKTLPLLLLGIVTFITNVYSQDVKKELEASKTKMDVFISKTGMITKFVDTKLPNLKTSFGGAETRIRKISSGATVGFFYQIVKESKYENSTASIEYNDLLEVLKAIKVLKPEVEKDIANKPDYLENKFITVDGFQVGYYISNAKASWYIKLEKYGSDNTLFIDNGELIETAFNNAKNKIEELKKNP
ncbi:hypothetical protein VRU48_12510 [Pedobacter sp. KR3-3]|uniref:Uncharacterized protein n=1 Tax=Pedobacter albus TaxID=3113905 RepID=A0ABU7I8Y1_9SPHI|nr:hypothetical protein [Pedobacter sp. KR3-3]MEE1945935.1 hypothetical protein [Pedobacter sp. KR3-3]